MSVKSLPSLAALYGEDETAWLDAMAELARDGRTEELDLPNLAEYLTDMARRDRKEVESRMIVLIMHLLKWDYQPERRSRSWRSTVIEQRQELQSEAGRGVLRNHASDVLRTVYTNAVERAAGETGMPADRFPVDCPYSLDYLLKVELPEVGD